MHNPMIGRVTSHYDLKRKHPVYGNVQPHRGIDLGAPVGIKPWDYLGAPVKAAYAGVVEQVCTRWTSGWGAIWGRSGCGVFIRNPDGEGQYYGHLQDVYVEKGQRVTEGQIIGGMGVSGNVTGPHLHFEIHAKGSGTRSNPNYTWTRDPMADFRAAGIIPGVEPIILAGTSAATTATVSEPGGLTVSEAQEIHARLDVIEDALGITKNSTSGKVVKDHGNGDTTTVVGAVSRLLTLVRRIETNTTPAEEQAEQQEVA